MHLDKLIKPGFNLIILLLFNLNLKKLGLLMDIDFGHRA